MSEEKTDFTIYSSTTGGVSVQKKETRMKNLLMAQKIKVSTRYLDLIDASEKQMVWTNGKKGELPLLFRGETFLGTCEEIDEKNEYGELPELLKGE